MEQVLRENKRFERIDRDTAAMLRAVTGTRIKINESEETVNMCAAIQEMIDESRAEGIEKGIEKGIYGLVRTLRRLQLSNEEIEEQIKFEYHLTDEQARQYLQPCEAK